MTKFRLLFASALMVAFSASANVAPAIDATSSDLEINASQQMRRMAPNKSLYTSTVGSHLTVIDIETGEVVTPNRAASDDQNQGYEPAVTLNAGDMLADLDGPNGELWYYTGRLYSRAIKYQYYTDYILEEYEFTLYNSKFEELGTIRDLVRYADDEERVPGPQGGIDLLPTITRNYFNSDDKYEVLVSIAVNTSTPGRNRYRSVVYSLNGEKETAEVQRNGVAQTIEVDIPVKNMDGWVFDVLNASTATEENYYFTTSPVGGYSYILYAKADAEGNLQRVHNFSVGSQTWQGDQENSPSFMTFVHDGTAYLLLPHYREDFFMPYGSANDDMVMREGNSLIIELYSIEGTTTSQVAVTEIPNPKTEGSNVLATFRSVGDLRYTGDILFDNNGTISYIVTKCDELTTGDSTTGYCYYVYDLEGNKVKTIFENAENNMPMSSIEGFPEQHMFVFFDEVDDTRYYNFVNIPEGYDKKKTVKIDSDLDPTDDADLLMFNADRVKSGDSYKYAFEMRTPSVDEYDNDVMRISWFNADGSYDRTDEINMGTAVHYAQVFITNALLSPEAIVSDSEQEYVILIKRGLVSGETVNQEELLIAQPYSEANPTGKNVMLLQPDEVKGNLALIGLYPGLDMKGNALLITYNGVNGVTADFYPLPFDLSSIENIEADGVTNSELSYDGTAIYAEGLEIMIFTTDGRLVANGKDAVAVDAIPAGVYVAVAGKSANKFIVK